MVHCAQRILCAASRLGESTCTLPVKSKSARLQRLRRPKSSGLQGVTRDVHYQLLLSARQFLHVSCLAHILVPRLERLLWDVQAHPGLSTAALQQQPMELLQRVASHGPLLSPHPQVC